MTMISRRLRNRWTAHPMPAYIAPVIEDPRLLSRAPQVDLTKSARMQADDDAGLELITGDIRTLELYDVTQDGTGIYSDAQEHPDSQPTVEVVLYGEDADNLPQTVQVRVR